ncbi:MAG: hypothetical protein IJ270_02880, partial [Paludibacteraceae bacterium]|nr:hypothetical protein [Paludibacteraceae bacterium]
MLLLNKQTEEEEIKDRNMAVFNQKQEVYHRFLEELHKICQDGKITIGVKDADGNIDKSVDELKDLIFQLGFLQLHTEKDTIKKVLNELVNMIEALKEFDLCREDTRPKAAPEFYSRMSKALFEIVAVLRTDLYGNEKESHPINEDQMKEVLKQINLDVVLADRDKYEAQRSFWNELFRQLKDNGYEVKGSEDSLAKKVTEYYAGVVERFGFDFSHPSLPIIFNVSIEDKCYYGIEKSDENRKYDDAIKQAIETIKFGEHNKDWYGWKYSSKGHDLDFSDQCSEGFNKLKDPKRSKIYIKGIADEIDDFAKEFM